MPQILQEYSRALSPEVRFSGLHFEHPPRASKNQAPFTGDSPVEPIGESEVHCITLLGSFDNGGELAPAQAGIASQQVSGIVRREKASVSIHSRGNAAPQVLLLRFKKRTLDSGH